MISGWFGLERPELERLVQEAGLPPFHGRQIYQWLYRRRVHDPSRWSNVPGVLRRRVEDASRSTLARVVERMEASDGTVKIRLLLADGAQVEAVAMRYENRVTLCLSSQVGCALACDFCLTGRMGWHRHLDAGEILAQARILEQDLSLEGPVHVVFMGMGEPLHNLEGLTRAVRILTDPEGWGLSRRRITVSTAGLVPAIAELAKEPRLPRLAVSLNAPSDALRNRLMPINRRYPIAALLEAVRRYAEAGGERVTLEYVLLAGVNDAWDHMTQLARLARGLPVKVNLIPFNEVPGRLPYRAPGDDHVRALRDRLLALRVPASIRWSRGREAQAACGQLAVLRDTPGRPVAPPAAS